MDAWIEIKVLGYYQAELQKSHPLWMRGLKYQSLYTVWLIGWSHPLWMRGLKSWYFDHSTWNISRILYGCVDWNGAVWCIKVCCFQVASFMDAWIEILSFRKNTKNHNVASFMDAWIEIASSCEICWLTVRRILYGCVDWNYSDIRSIDYEMWSHPLWMRGLKLSFKKFFPRVFNVASFMDAWIEIGNWLFLGELFNGSHPLWMRGLKF